MSLADDASISLDEFIDKMKEIREKGYVRSHRHHDTGIGKTLEDLLGITENNVAGPDFSSYELKSARKGSVSMLTLFTKEKDNLRRKDLCGCTFVPLVGKNGYK